MLCPKCKTINLAGSTYCEKCGRPLSESLMEGPVEGGLLEGEVGKKLQEIREHLKSSLHLQDLPRILKDKQQPVTNTFIAFIVWGILRFSGVLPFIIVTRALAFLLGPVGLVVILAVTYVYSAHKKEILERLERLKKRGAGEEG